MRWGVLGIDLQGQAAEGTSVLAAGGENALAVSGKNGEDAFYRFADSRECGVHDHGAQ